jgi:hypothetical protein
VADHNPLRFRASALLPVGNCVEKDKLVKVEPLFVNIAAPDKVNVGYL